MAAERRRHGAALARIAGNEGFPTLLEFERCLGESCDAAMTVQCRRFTPRSRRSHLQLGAPAFAAPAPPRLPDWRITKLANRKTSKRCRPGGRVPFVSKLRDCGFPRVSGVAPVPGAAAVWLRVAAVSSAVGPEASGGRSAAALPALPGPKRARAAERRPEPAWLPRRAPGLRRRGRGARRALIVPRSRRCRTASSDPQRARRLARN